jgi:broad-specificity NMP kinase
MKKIIFINGTMGVGKTATSNELHKLLPKSVFLDGDWCWDMSPFIVTEETKRMVLDNISHLLNNFLSCSEFEHVIFCWVMHEQGIINDVLSRLNMQDSRLYVFSLVCSEEALRSRLTLDVQNGLRTDDVIARSIQRLGNYTQMDSVKVDVTELTASQAAEEIFDSIYPENKL